MEISEIRLMNLANSNARAKVMVKQWYPELFKERDEELRQLSTLRSLRDLSSPLIVRSAVRTDVGVIRDANGDELLIGQWYTDNINHIMIYSETSSSCKGFYDGNWGNTWCFPYAHSAVPATRELVQSMLRKECEIRGYTSNNFMSFAGTYTGDFPINQWYYEEGNDSMYSAPMDEGGLCMYKQGSWAPQIRNSQIEF